MRVLTLSNYYPPYLLGGYEIACKDMMDYLEDNGHTIHVVTSEYLANNEVEKNINRSMKLINYDKPSMFNKSIVEHHNYKITLQEIENFKPDIVYIWSLRGIGLSVIEAVDKKNIPKIFEIGDFWMKGFIRDDISFKIKQSIKSILPCTHTKKVVLEPNICVSNWVANEMREVYKTSNNYVFPNSIHVPSNLKVKHNKELHFLFTGRIDIEKGLDLAIQALTVFHSIHPHESFVFNIYGTGDKEYIEHCKNLARPIEDKVIFHGYSNNREKMYDEADILLMPTKMREPFGLVIIEAMANGCCVIATDAYGPAEIIEHNVNGLLFMPGSMPDLLKNILQLYTSKKDIELLKNAGYEHVKLKYNIKHTKPKIESLLQNLIKEVL